MSTSYVHKCDGLHRFERLRFSYGGLYSEGCVECRYTAPIEASAVPTRALARQGHPRPLRIVGAINQPLEPHPGNWKSSVAACHDLIEIGVYVVGLVLEH